MALVVWVASAVQADRVVSAALVVSAVQEDRVVSAVPWDREVLEVLEVSADRAVSVVSAASEGAPDGACFSSFPLV